MAQNRTDQINSKEPEAGTGRWVPLTSSPLPSGGALRNRRTRSTRSSALWPLLAPCTCTPPSAAPSAPQQHPVAALRHAPRIACPLSTARSGTRDRRPTLHAAHRQRRASHTKRRWLADRQQLPINYLSTPAWLSIKEHQNASHLPIALFAVSRYTGHEMPAACRFALLPA